MEGSQMGSAAVIFPGQGAQTVGMGRDVADSCRQARAVFDQANEILGFDLATLCFNGPAEELERTDIQQPAIFVTSVALWAAVVEGGGKLEAFSWAGGLSLGEYTALHITGAVGFEDGLRLVRRRGELMQEAALQSPSGMVSLIGADREKAEAICKSARGGDVLAPANFNCPGQVVISGSKGACKRAIDVASQHDCRAIALAVAGAFHSPLMAPAAKGLWPVLAETPFSRPRIPVVANTNAKEHEDETTIRETLRDQVTHPVLWQRCIEQMIEDGVGRFYEIGPGRSLTGMMRKINRKMTALNVSSGEAIADAIQSLRAAQPLT